MANRGGDSQLQTLQSLFPNLTPEVIQIVQQRCGGDLEKTIITLSSFSDSKSATTPPAPQHPQPQQYPTQAQPQPQAQPQVQYQPQPQYPAPPPQYHPQQHQQYAPQPPYPSHPQYPSQPQAPYPQQYPQQPTQQRQAPVQVQQTQPKPTPPQQQGQQQQQPRQPNFKQASQQGQQPLWMQFLQQHQQNQHQNQQLNQHQNQQPQQQNQQPAWMQAIQMFQQQHQQQQQPQQSNGNDFVKPDIPNEYDLAPAGFVPQNVPSAPLIQMKLTDTQKQFFMQNGYIVVPDVVSKHLTDAALRVINKKVGQGTGGAEMALHAKFKTWFPDLCISSEILNLFYQSALFGMVQDLLGQFEKPNAGQITMRFPGDLCVESDKGFGKMLGLLSNLQNPQNASASEGLLPIPFWEKTWHVDGLSVLNGKQKDMKTFTLLAGVMLHDVDDELFGNLTVFPGSHLAISNYVNSLGGAAALMGPNIDRKQIPLQAPVQVKGKRGSIVIFHGLLAHAVAPNTSPNIRYKIYYRISSKKPEYRPEVVERPFCEFPGVQHLIPKK